MKKTIQWDSLHWGPVTAVGFFNALPVIAVAYTCQFNVFPIWSELEKPTLKRMGTVAMISMCLSSFLYITAGFFGYIVFPNTSQTGGNVLVSLDSTTFNTVLRCFFVVAILFHYPVVHFSFREIIEKVIFARYEWNPVRHTLETIITICFTLGLAIKIPSLTDVFGLTGAVASFPICFILPMICYIRLVILSEMENGERRLLPVSRESVLKKWNYLVVPSFVAVLMVIIMCIAIVTSILQLIK